jgi:DNA (cytosine-5)-methyltransferase 1
VNKPPLIDLCCSAGLASEGYAEYFDVVGVDVDPQPNYPYRFIRKDVRDLDPGWLSGFAIVAGSPPCQWGTNLKSL